MKRFTRCVIYLICAVTWSCCLASPAQAAAPETGQPLRIVTTIFPLYDWTMEILGERADGAEVAMLADDGVDLHSFTPTAEDMLKIAQCDLFICIGGESEKWVEDTLKGSHNEAMKVIRALDELGDAALEETMLEGMQAEPENPDEEEGTLDEHVWLSLRKAGVLTDVIAGALAELDPDGKAVYEEQAAAYREKLDALDQAYEAAAEGSEVKTLLFADRFPFQYLADDYGVTCYAAFAGCSAETQASFETVIFLAQKTDELGLKVILTIENSDQKLAQTVRDNTSGKDQEILAMNSMQSVTGEEAAAGAGYLDIMEQNLAVWTEAL